MTGVDWVSAVTGIASLVAALAALRVSFAAKDLQTQANEAQERAEEHTLRTERREFVTAVDGFAMWYSERVIGNGAPDPGPIGSLIPAAQALRLYASRLTQPGAEALSRWALDLLGRMYRDESGMRPFEETHVIAATASLWVVDRHVDLDAAIAQVDPAYEAKPR